MYKQVQYLLRHPVPRALLHKSYTPSEEVPAAVAIATPQIARSTPRQMRFETSCV